MLTISGTVKELRRVRVKAPDDLVHRVSTKDGCVKGVSCFLLDGKLLPKGQTGFYHKYKPQWGVKVMYKVDNEKCYRASKKAVMKEWRNRKKLEPYGIIPKSPKTVKVNLDLKFKGKRIRTWAWAIKTEHINYPKKILDKFAHGYPYDFSGLDVKEHPQHTPEGYLKFCDFLTKKLKKAGVGVCGNYPFKEKKPPKLGDVLYDTKKKKWYLVDVA